MEIKQDLVSQHHINALLTYFGNPKHLQRRKEIDIGIIKLFKGDTTKDEEDLIDHYWNFLLTAVHAQEIFKKFQSHTQHVLTTVFCSFTDQATIALQEMMAKGQKDSGQSLIQYLDQLIAAAKQELEQQKVARGLSEKKLLDYLMMMEEWKMRTLGNRLIIAALQEIYSMKSRLAEIALSVITENNQSIIKKLEASHDKFIEEWKEKKIQIKKIPDLVLKHQKKLGAIKILLKKGAEVNRDEFVQLKKMKKKITNNISILNKQEMLLPKECEDIEKNIVNIRKDLSTLRSRNVEDFKKEACLELNFNPDEFFRDCPSANQRLDMLLDLNNGESYSDDFCISDDLRVDLSQGELIDKFERIDCQQAELLRPKVEEVVEFF